MNDFGKVIYSYSREQAIEDGILIDISQTNEAKQAGFRIPIVATDHLYNKISNFNKGCGQSFEGRLWDVCFVAAIAFKRKKASFADNEQQATIPFQIKFSEDDSNTTLWLCFNSAEGFTVMFPEDY